MKKLKDKNLPKALEAINRTNMQSERNLVQSLKRNSKLELSQPKISDKEL